MNQNRMASFHLEKIPPENYGHVASMPSTKVTLTGTADSFVRTFIHQHDRFAEYDEGNLLWAEPLGLCESETRLLRPGDEVFMDVQLDREGTSYQMAMTCVEPPRPISRPVIGKATEPIKPPLFETVFEVQQTSVLV